MIKRIILVLSILILGNIIFNPVYSSATELTTFFNQQWLKTVVSIEMINEKKEMKPIGTGFLVQSNNNHLLLVTAKHIVIDENNENNKINKSLLYRYNLHSGKSIIISDEDLMKSGAGSWFLSESADIAIRFMYLLPESDF